jgi:hypothetical protein
VIVVAFVGFDHGAASDDDFSGGDSAMDDSAARQKIERPSSVSPKLTAATTAWTDAVRTEAPPPPRM